jgi:hypothetical protein
MTNANPPFELPTPTLGRDGGPNTDADLIVATVDRATRCWRMAMAFISSLVDGLRGEEAAATAGDFHVNSLGLDWFGNGDYRVAKRCVRKSFAINP